jgi:FMN phosphatase YigB (HAD superfamily)
MKANLLNNKNIIIVRQKRFGLGNKILSWANAFYWSKKNDANVVVTGWTHIPFKSILRREQTLRWYRGFFKTNFFQTIKNLRLYILPFKAITEITQNPGKKEKRHLLQLVPKLSDLNYLKEFRKEIISEFYKLINIKLLNRTLEIKNPVIGVHIRLGDFVNIGYATEIDYYVQVINKLREQAIKPLPVTIFTDGTNVQLKEILKLPLIEVFKSENDLIDLLVLSSSQFLVTSKGSTYSYWAAFLNEHSVIHHPNTWLKESRDQQTNSIKFEGILDFEYKLPSLLIKHLEDFQSTQF